MKRGAKKMMLWLLERVMDRGAMSKARLPRIALGSGSLSLLIWFNAEVVLAGSGSALCVGGLYYFKAGMRRLSNEPVWPIGKGVRLVSRRVSARFRFGSPFSSERLWFVGAVLRLCPS